MSQILAGAGPYNIVKTWYVDGTPTNVGDVTIGITDGNGDTVVAGGTATTNNADGTYTYSLADYANPDQLKITWTRTSSGADLVDRLELVGSWLFTENQARTFAAKADATTALIPLANSSEYPDGAISNERTRITEDLEYWTGRAWIPRYARLEMSGNGGSSLSLRNGFCRTSDGYALNRPGRLNDIAELLSISVNGSSVSVGSVEVDPIRARLHRTSGIFDTGTIDNPYNITVEYVYGPPFIIDGVDRIALKLLVDRLVPSAVPDRALRWEMPDGSSMSIVQPGGPMNNVSRLPEVNQWVAAHNHKVLVG